MALTLFRPFVEISSFYQFLLMGVSVLIGLILLITVAVAYHKKRMTLKQFLIFELMLLVIIAFPYLLLILMVSNLH